MLEYAQYSQHGSKMRRVAAAFDELLTASAVIATRPVRALARFVYGALEAHIWSYVAAQLRSLVIIADALADAVLLIPARLLGGVCSAALGLLSLDRPLALAGQYRMFVTLLAVPGVLTDVIIQVLEGLRGTTQEARVMTAEEVLDASRVAPDFAWFFRWTRVITLRRGHLFEAIRHRNLKSATIGCQLYVIGEVPRALMQQEFWEIKRYGYGEVDDLGEETLRSLHFSSLIRDDWEDAADSGLAFGLWGYAQKRAFLRFGLEVGKAFTATVELLEESDAFALAGESKAKLVMGDSRDYTNLFCAFLTL